MSVAAHARTIGRGAAVGAGLAAAGQIASTLWVVLTTEKDEASARAAQAVNALGDERWTFLLSIIGLCAVAGAILGAAQAMVRAVARRASGGMVSDVAYTLALTTFLVLGRASQVPALLGPALPLPRGMVGWLAAHVPPYVFYAVPALAAVVVFVRAFRGRRRAIAAAVLPVTLLAGALGPAACTHRAATRAAGAPPNVLVLAADSIRPDHLSALGYARPTTPNIDRLIAEGTVFDHTMAPLAMTTPSWTSILTGRYPHGHGIRHMFPDRRLRPKSLDALPRVAAEKGYRTSVLSDYAGDFFPIFDFGFAEAHLPPPLNARTVFQREILSRSPLAIAFLEPLPQRIRPACFRYMMNAADADRLADEVIRELDDNAPFFIVAFFSTTHVPFASRHPYDLRFTSPDYTGEHRFAYNLTSLADIARAEAQLSPEDAAQLIGLYDGALASVDAAVGRVLEGLSARGLDRDTLVVFLSDHGENLFEPGQTTLHGKWFRGGDEANRVPFVIRGPNVAAGRRISQPVSLVDVSPTLTELLGLRPLDRVDGRSLAPALRGEPLAERPVFAETGAWLNGAPDKASIPTPALVDLLEADATDDGQIILKPRYEDVVTEAKHRAVWMGDLKLLYEPSPTGVAFHLYDVAKDPKQSRDLMGQRPEAGPMVQKMFDWLGRDPERELDPRGHVVRR